jgi:hypothetical protein
LRFQAAQHESWRSTVEQAARNAVVLQHRQALRHRPRRLRSARLAQERKAQAVG